MIRALLASLPWRRREEATRRAAALREQCRRTVAAARAAREPECPDCHGAGEVFTHADDCRYDTCALNGDIDSCDGQVIPCPCCKSGCGAFLTINTTKASKWAEK